MVAGLAFLSKKGFNPANRSNQKAVWEAKQEKEQEIRRIKEREDQLRRERDDEELARARGVGDEATTLRFMYAPPPGLAAASGGPMESTDEVDDGDITVTSKVDAGVAADKTTCLTAERQPGDDDAAAAFRQMLAAANPDADDNADEKDSSSQVAGAAAGSSGTALTGTNIEKSYKNDELSALEKAVGRKGAGSSLTLEEQIARFPQLKNAPMAKGMNATNVGVTFKPLGTQLRNVRCMVCGVWGHSRGDRECQLSGWDPFSGRLTMEQGRVTRDSDEREQERKRDRVESSSDDESRQRRKRHRDESSSDDDSRRRRKRHRKHKKSRRHESKRSRRSSSEERHRSRKSSHKKSKKRSRHDD